MTSGGLNLYSFVFDGGGIILRSKNCITSTSPLAQSSNWTNLIACKRFRDRRGSHLPLAAVYLSRRRENKTQSEMMSETSSCIRPIDPLLRSIQTSKYRGSVGSEDSRSFVSFSEIWLGSVWSTFGDEISPDNHECNLFQVVGDGKVLGMLIVDCDSISLANCLGRLSDSVGPSASMLNENLDAAPGTISRKSSCSFLPQY